LGQRQRFSSILSLQSVHDFNAAILSEDLIRIVSNSESFMFYFFAKVMTGPGVPDV